MQDTDTFEMLSQADMQGFARVEAGVMEVAANISTTSDYLDMLENRLADLNTGASTFTATANNTSTRVRKEFRYSNTCCTWIAHVSIDTKGSIFLLT